MKIPDTPLPWGNSPFKSRHTFLVRAALISAGRSALLEEIVEWSGLTEEEVLRALPEASKIGGVRFTCVTNLSLNEELDSRLEMNLMTMTWDDIKDRTVKEVLALLALTAKEAREEGEK